jgi:hypothetical protein
MYNRMLANVHSRTETLTPSRFIKSTMAQCSTCGHDVNNLGIPWRIDHGGSWCPECRHPIDIQLIEAYQQQRLQQERRPARPVSRLVAQFEQLQRGTASVPTAPSMQRQVTSEEERIMLAAAVSVSEQKAESMSQMQIALAMSLGASLAAAQAEVGRVPGMLQALPPSLSRSTSADEICAICHISLASDGVVGTAEPCFYRFHVDCMQEWQASGSPNAPNCDLSPHYGLIQCFINSVINMRSAIQTDVQITFCRLKHSCI